MLGFWVSLVERGLFWHSSIGNHQAHVFSSAMSLGEGGGSLPITLAVMEVPLFCLLASVSLSGKNRHL